MIATISVADDGRNPYGVKAHSLNIVEVVDNSTVSTSTIVA
jgi:hypothetical protein